MSAAQNKTKHNSDGFNFGKSSNLKGKKQDSSKKTARIAIITVAVVAVLFVGALFINSNYFRQNFAAVKVDNVKYSITDFNYYYESMYIQYVNAMQGYGDLGSSMLPKPQTSLKSQVYDESTGETWSDLFESMALKQIQADTKIYKEALKENFQIPDDQKTKMNSEIDNLKQTAYAYGFSNFSDYLQNYYGKSMDEATYRKCVERAYVISSYTDHMRDKKTYTPEELKSFYQDNKGTLDTFTFRYFLVKAPEVNKSDYPDDASYQAALGAAVEAAGVKANEYKAQITNAQTFIDAARDYDPETNKDDSSTERVYKGDLLGSIYGDYLRDPNRLEGDVETFKTTNGYYVVMYESRNDNNYPTVNAQMIVVKQESLDKSQYSDDAAYNKAVDDAKKAAQDKADAIYKEFQDGGATQDKLKELTTSHSTEIDATDSKLNENIYNGQMPDEVNAWLYDSARKAGESTEIYAEGKGYYIVWFAGPGRQYSDVLAETKMRDNDLQAWKDSLTAGDPKSTWLMTLAE